MSHSQQDLNEESCFVESNAHFQKYKLTSNCFVQGISKCKSSFIALVVIGKEVVNELFQIILIIDVSANNFMVEGVEL